MLETANGGPSPRFRIKAKAHRIPRPSLSRAEVAGTRRLAKLYRSSIEPADRPWAHLYQVPKMNASERESHRKVNTRLVGLNAFTMNTCARSSGEWGHPFYAPL